MVTPGKFSILRAVNTMRELPTELHIFTKPRYNGFCRIPVLCVRFSVLCTGFLSVFLVVLHCLA